MKRNENKSDSKRDKRAQNKSRHAVKRGGYLLKRVYSSDLDSFTDCSTQFAVPACSPEAVRSLSADPL